ncbi:unnamed protein product [Brassicogethes aeneus]|uniref:BED-type domain-containing protein n=1 Tax=Brassicogethes aeneus TaxID=1431903 RepID=A0A9P0BGQ4_BRAAE|nr:unnamed protein product [Brassicogethes aeneus]
MKRSRQTFLKFAEHLSDRSDSANETVEMDDSDKDKDYTPVQEVESESDSEIYESDQPSTSKSKLKGEKKSKRSKIVKTIETKQSHIIETKLLSQSGSKYLQHFTVTLLPNNAKVASCNLCKKMNIKTDNIKMSQSNTSGLKWHLKKKHQQEFSSLFPSKSKVLSVGSVQPTLDNVFKSKTKIVSSVKDEDIVEWVCLKYLPFSFFDDEHTQTFFKKLNPTAVLPKRTALRKKKYQLLEVKIRQCMSPWSINDLCKRNTIELKK